MKSLLAVAAVLLFGAGSVLAAGKSAEISVQTETVSPSTTYAVIYLDTKGNKVGFAKTTVVFDPSKVSVTDEVQTTPLLKTVIEKTPAAEANRMGMLIISLGLAIDDRPRPVAGRAELARFKIKTSNNGGNITPELNKSQVVDLETNILTLSGKPAVLPGKQGGCGVRQWLFAFWSFITRGKFICSS